MNPDTIKVRKIFTRGADGFSQVSIDINAYRQIVGFDTDANPDLKPYKTTASSTGQGVRVFDFNGVKVYTSYDKATKKMLPIMMKTTDAEANLETLEKDALPFCFEMPKVD